MAQIVYTNIERIERLGLARWSAGDQDSYEATKRMARATGDGLLLIGRRDLAGSVSLAFAATQYTDWAAVGTWHLKLALFFGGKLAEAPKGDTLKPFFDEIDYPAAANAVVQLVGIDAGTSASKEEVRAAVNRICHALRALGVPAGDWAGMPMIAACLPPLAA